jgi:hypothetical protein
LNAIRKNYDERFMQEKGLLEEADDASQDGESKKADGFQMPD